MNGDPHMRAVAWALLRPWAGRGAAFATGLALCLTCTAGAPGRPPEGPVEAVAEDFSADAPDAGAVEVDARRLPPAEDFPPTWQRAPHCPRDPRVRVVHGACFVHYGEPPCGVGYTHEGECLVALARGERLPASLGK